MDEHFSHLQKLLLAYSQMPMHVDPWISPRNIEVRHIRWYSSPWWSNAYLVTPFRWRFFILSTTEVLLTIDFYWNLFCKQDNWWKWNSTPTCSSTIHISSLTAVTFKRRSHLNILFLGDFIITDKKTIILCDVITVPLKEFTFWFNSKVISLGTATMSISFAPRSDFDEEDREEIEAYLNQADQIHHHFPGLVTDFPPFILLTMDLLNFNKVRVNSWQRSCF